ncbi:MAG TPA: hypothetical protein VH440_07275 [Candidatus Limnocylindrales bacterium]|jgi:hypothetical protein
MTGSTEGRAAAPAHGPSIRFVDEPLAAGPADAGERVVVLDPAWTPRGDEPAIPIRTAARRALATQAPLDRALELVDRFADQAGLDEALTVDGVALWPRRRLVAWRRLHDLVLWRAILTDLGVGRGTTVRADAPPEALRDVLAAAGLAPEAERRPATATADSAAPDGRRRQATVARRLARRVRSIVGGRPNPAVPPAADAHAGDRERLLAAFGADRRRLLVLTDSGVHQEVETDDGPRRLDPFLGPIVNRLRGTALEPVVVDLATGSAPADGAASFRAITAGTDDPAARASARSAAESASTSLRAAVAGVDLDGVDVGPVLLDDERRFVADGIAPWLLTRGRIERFLATARPAGLLLINEYGRPEWLSAARRQGIPVAAVQHGIIHRAHAGYVLPHRTPALVLADRTYLFGDFERRLLTAGVYREHEVRVAGSPRLDLLAAHDAATSATEAAAERQRIREALGAGAGERLVVFSSTNNPDLRRLVVAPILAAVLDRALPNVRLVVKLHPAEAPHDLYERLAAGLAAAGGFDPPPVSVIRDVDLYALLRAADAHLGIHSTVLTDAVVAGVRNLIVTGFPGGDLLDYVARGVATPVRDGGDLLAALDAPPPAPDDAGRAAFLADQLDGADASERIAADLVAWLGG